MSRLSDLEVFVEVVRAGTFTGAAERLGISKSYVSKQVRALEERLGGQLLIRNTRHTALTASGQAYYDRCSRALELIDEAEEELGSAEGQVRGTVRITAPVALGVHWVMPALATAVRDHPHLRLDLHFSDARVDLVEEGFDLAIRAGFELPDSTLMVRRLGRFRLGLVASPDYLRRHGRPTRPAELSDHRCLSYSHTRSSGRWTFAQRDGTEHSVLVEGPVVADSGAALVEAAEQGLGIARQPDFLTRDGLATGRLEPLLADFEVLPAGSVWAVWPPGRREAAKVAACVRVLSDELNFGGETRRK